MCKVHDVTANVIIRNKKHQLAFRMHCEFKHWCTLHPCKVRVTVMDENEDLVS